MNVPIGFALWSLPSPVGQTDVSNRNLEPDADKHAGSPMKGSANLA